MGGRARVVGGGLWVVVGGWWLLGLVSCWVVLHGVELFGGRGGWRWQVRFGSWDLPGHAWAYLNLYALAWTWVDLPELVCVDLLVCLDYLALYRNG